MKIYIVRHGETLANKKGILQGSINTDLTDFGVSLAKITGKGLKDINFDICYSSPLGRASDTAKLILKENNNKNIKIIYDDRLKEINMGEWEGKCIKPDASEIPLELVQLFFNNPFLLKDIKNGETALEVCKRTQDFLHELVKYDYENVLITSHGFAVRALLNFLYDDPSNFWQGHVPYNCAVNIIEYKNGKFSLLEKDKIYYNKEQCIDRYKLK